MRINYSNIKFDKAYGTLAQLPGSTLPEISFAGRSNVGKSSLINKLFNRKGLAKVSATPGKTATINFFDAQNVHFVDLPGYGFAKVAKSDKGRWAELIEGYFNQQRRFALVCSLVDIRHEASPLDVNMIAFLNEMHLPYTVVLTKADKIGPMKAQAQRDLLREQLNVPNGVTMTITSSEKGTGIDDLRKLIEAAADKPRAIR